MDNFFGVPAHPFFVHVPVVCIPLAAIGAIAIALRPQWRRTYGPIVLALALIGMVGAVLAGGSGESLQEAKHIRNLGDHGELGEMARNVSFLLFASVFGLVVMDRWGATDSRLRKLPSWIRPLLAAACIVTAIGATVTVSMAGHSGAKRVWVDESSVQAGR